MRKFKVLTFVFVLVLSFAVCIPVKAALAFDPPFIDIANQWTVNNVDPTDSVRIVSSTWDSLTKSGTDHIDRDINGVVYSADTVTYEHDPLQELQDITVQFYPTYSIPSSYYNDKRAGSFQYWDTYFLINFYCPDGLNFPTSLSDNDYFGTSSGRIVNLIDQMTGESTAVVSNGSNVVNAGYRDSNHRSYTIILQVSYLDYSTSQYFSKGAIEFTLRTWDFGIGGNPFSIDASVYVDVGVIAYSFGYTNQDLVYIGTVGYPSLRPPEDIWGGLVPMEPVYIDPSVAALSAGDIFGYINSLNLVTDIFVPIGVAGVTFFSIRTVFWKEV